MPTGAGYIVYDTSNPTIAFQFDKAVGDRGIETVSTSKVENRLELKTFGKYPYVYYAGQTDYKVFDLTTVFIRDEENNISAREQVNNFKTLIKQRIPLAVEDSEGQVFMCDVQLTGESKPKLFANYDMEYIEISIKCTQIDD